MKKDMTKKEMQKMLEALQAQLAQVQAEKENAVQAQEKAQAQAEKAVEEFTGYSADRLAYEEKKFDESITCKYEFPAYFAQDTVTYRAQHNAHLIALGRKYIQTVMQAGTAQVTRKAGRQAQRTAHKAGTAQGTAHKADEHALYDAVSRQAGNNTLTIVHSDKYSTLKKEGKTVARLYFQRDAIKALVKEDSAKNAGIAYTLMKFNLPASCILHDENEIAQLFKAF